MHTHDDDDDDDDGDDDDDDDDSPESTCVCVREGEREREREREGLHAEGGGTHVVRGVHGRVCLVYAASCDTVLDKCLRQVSQTSVM